MGDWYPTIKSFNGLPYLYRQRSWRDAGRTRGKTQYIGRIDLSASRGDLVIRQRRNGRRGDDGGEPATVFRLGIEDEFQRRAVALGIRFLEKQEKSTT